MADLHGQTLVTELGTAQRIAAGEEGQTGAVNILPDNLRLQFTAPTTGETFTGGNIDLGNLRGTYYASFNQSGDITFTFTNPVNGGNAFIRINSNGTGTFTFTAVEAFGVTSGGTLPAGNHLFRFLQTPYGVSVAVFREVSAGITNAAANNEIPLSDGTNLISSRLFVNNIIPGIFILNTVNDDLSIRAGNGSQTTNRNLSIQSTPISDSSSSGNVTITTGAVSGSGNAPGNVLISTGNATAGASSGNVSIQGLTWPNADGTSGDFLRTSGGAVLSFANPLDIGTPAERITALSSSANATSIDFLSQSRFREFSLTLSENTTVSFSNATNRSSYKIFLIISGATRTITLPTGSLMPVSTSNSSDIVWTSSLRELQLGAGGYELAADYNGTNDFWKITDRYA